MPLPNSVRGIESLRLYTPYRLASKECCHNKKKKVNITFAFAKMTFVKSATSLDFPDLPKEIDTKLKV